MPRVAILDDYQQVALGAADWDSLPGCTVEAFSDHLEDDEALVTRLDPFQVIVAMRERTAFPRELLERLPRLELLVTTGAANAAIDTEAAVELGVTVCGTRGLGHSTAELTWGLILALLRHIPEEHAAVRAGRWQDHMGHTVRGKTLGLIGLGRLGGQVAEVGRAFGVELLAWSENLGPERAKECGATLVTRNELLERSDIVSIHVRLSPRTRGLLGVAELGRMQEHAYLVNTSRGPIVDEAALVEALKQGTIAGAALDVFDREPLPADHPFRSLDNVLLSPHKGYVTHEDYAVFYGDAVEDVAGFLRGDPQRVIARPGM